MQQIKIFKGVENDVETLADEVNAWIESANVRVLQITGNIAPQTQGSDHKTHQLGSVGYAASDVLIIVLYEAA
ncbi:hypothetical protein HQ560_11825 [bacterium]|nr:hypothetical protein [bacterium]